MKVDNDTIRDLATARDIDGLYKTCTALHRELVAKNDLIERYSTDIDRLNTATKELSERCGVIESERNLLQRVCRRLEVVCGERDMKEDYQAAWQEYDLTASGA